MTDIQLWNTNSEGIDVFVKKSAIEEVGQRLTDGAIQYEVIVENYQGVIDEENPSEEEIQQLQGQNGKWDFCLIVIS